MNQCFKQEVKTYRFVEVGMEQDAGQFRPLHSPHSQTAPVQSSSASYPSLPGLHCSLSSSRPGGGMFQESVQDLIYRNKMSHTIQGCPPSSIIQFYFQTTNTKQILYRCINMDRNNLPWYPSVHSQVLDFGLVQVSGAQTNRSHTTSDQEVRATGEESKGQIQRKQSN